MPSTSKKQAKAMRAACHDEETRSSMGISKKTACHWAAEDKRRGTKKLPRERSNAK